MAGCHAQTARATDGKLGKLDLAQMHKWM